MRRFLLALWCLTLTLVLQAQTASVRNAVQAWAEVQASPARITVKWLPMNGATGYTVYRMPKGGSSWGSSIASLGGGVNEYQDNAVVTGTAYEYRIDRTGGNVGGSGYLLAGINVPIIEHRGTMVLVVDDSFVSSLATEITQLITDLRADGWHVVRHNVSRNATPASVRSLIQGTYNADQANVKAVYLLGHVPVPYSGNLNPDGHPDHRGAWPADGYYGEMNGTWTDNSVNNTSSQNARNHNVPGDGKFDQSDFPSALELQVGRVDFFEFESFQYYQGLNEMQLLRNYLIRAHEFKSKQFTPQFRGCVFDNFDDVGIPLGGSGYKSISALVGPQNLTDLNPNGAPFTTHINGQSYLWTYSSGGGSWSLASNVGGTWDFAQNVSMGGVFNMMFGSYFGDWNVQNNFLRAPLGSGRALTNVWSALPSWFFHQMAMGEGIGYSTRASMNNTSLYQMQNPNSAGSPTNRVHMALMGDPSLRQLMVPQPGSVQIGNSNGTAAFSWGAASAPVDGYHIYQVDAATGQGLRLTGTPVTGTSHIDPTIPFVAGREFMVRAVKLENGPTGTWNNLSLASFGTASASVGADCLGVVGGPAMPGTSCNDNDPCTTNDVYNAGCQCAGTPGPDTDGDGICDAQDDCPSKPGEIGSACNDNDPCTTNDVLGSDCQCHGTPVPDADGDGLCNAVDNCPNTPGQIGSSCNDNDPCTTNDVVGANCQCAGTVQDTDGDGVCNAQDSCPNTPGQVGSPCDDGDAGTINDVLNSSCQCVGITVGLDCLGTPDGTALPGTPCNDNNPNTGNDLWTAACECQGQLIDCTGVPGGAQVPGAACDDGDPCTVNDQLKSDCQCSGQPVPDSDGDGACDLVDDCPQVFGGVGSPCDDADASTANDVIGQDCTCAGITIDCSGVVGGPDLPGTPCNGLGGLWTLDCECVGGSLPLDCAGVPGGEATLDQCGVCSGGATGVEPDPDGDTDGILDCDDVCPSFYDPLQQDFDGDGVGDACDNCVWVPNTDQVDANGNGIGDACEMINGMFEQGGGAQDVLEAYPNPALDELFIKAHRSGVRWFRVHDLAGKATHEWPFAPRLDVRSLAAGTYVLIALDAEGRAIGRTRFVKQ